ncbi:DeoR family transcriptional regulator [Moraxella osloensis]|nr:DeoR family transcriptional regulator [Moraxella osloensis]
MFKLNQGEKLNKKQLAEEFNVHIRTISRDLDERLSFLPFTITDNTYSLRSSYLGKFNVEDINRFAKFASVKDLFGKIDQAFFQKYLTDSITIKSYQAESIAHKQQDFDLINEAIQKKQTLKFSYQRVSQRDGKSRCFEVEPYKLVNNLGIWYLVALHDEKIKVFSITKISLPQLRNRKFIPNAEIIETIENGDGIYFEGVMDEVILKVSANVAMYFTRRAVLPNQEIVKEMTDGTLIVMCKKVHEQSILPLVRYWIPHVEIVAPDSMKVKLMQQLQQYMESPLSDQV